MIVLAIDKKDKRQNMLDKIKTNKINSKNFHFSAVSRIGSIVLVVAK